MAPSVFALCIWFATPIQWFDEWGVNQRTSGFSIVAPWLVAFVSFSFGYLIQKLFFRLRKVSPGLATPLIVKNVQLVIVLSATFSLLFVIAMAIRTGGPLGFLMPYTVRSSYIAGLSTFLHGTTVIAIMISVLYLVDKSLIRVSILAGTIAFLIILYRVFIGYERLALFIPFLAVFTIYLRLRQPLITPKLIGICLGALAMLICIYILAEYYRSYSAKMEYGEAIHENPIVYGLQRFVLYFSTSVNTGGLRFMFFEEGLDQRPVFSVTLPPLAKILYAVFGTSMFQLKETYLQSLEIAQQMGAYNEEFNNAWSIPMSFTEGWWVGVVYWVIWGGVAGITYRRFVMKTNSIWDLCIYGLFVAAFVDNQSRVALLGAIHFLMPFGLFICLKQYFDWFKHRSFLG